MKVLTNVEQYTAIELDDNCKEIMCSMRKIFREEYSLKRKLKTAEEVTFKSIFKKMDAAHEELMKKTTEWMIAERKFYDFTN